MTMKDVVLGEISQLSDRQLRQVAEYIAFLRFRTRRSSAIKLPEGAELAALYAEAATEDRELAETDMAAYNAGLKREDSL